jgi:PhnB protein
MNFNALQVNPYLSFNGTCEAAFKFYAQLLGGSIECMMTYESRPGEYPVPAEWGRKILHATLRVGDQVLMGADALPDRYQKPQGFSLTLGLKDPSQAERIFKALAENGTVEMPLQERPSGPSALACWWINSAYRGLSTANERLDSGRINF